tara:strand:- start:430 stop:606 length:177 start_codon:yes stop_codon:yes gene_type:complete
MKKSELLEWGVFIETTEGKTFEVILPEELATQVVKFLNEEDIQDLSVNGANTNGEILW